MHIYEPLWQAMMQREQMLLGGQPGLPNIPFMYVLYRVFSHG
jgi:hypothetical protein